MSKLKFKAGAQYTVTVHVFNFLTTNIYQQIDSTEPANDSNGYSTSIAEVTASNYWKKEHDIYTISPYQSGSTLEEQLGRNTQHTQHSYCVRLHGDMTDIPKNPTNLLFREISQHC